MQLNLCSLEQWWNLAQQDERGFAGKLPANCLCDGERDLPPPREAASMHNTGYHVLDHVSMHRRGLASFRCSRVMTPSTVSAACPAWLVCLFSMLTFVPGVAINTIVLVFDLCRNGDAISMSAISILAGFME